MTEKHTLCIRAGMYGILFGSYHLLFLSKMSFVKNMYQTTFVCNL